MAARKLKVLPNPYAAIDHDGIPSGTYSSDPGHVPTKQAIVGGRVDNEGTKIGVHPDVAQNPSFADSTDRSNPQITRWAFEAEIVELPDTPHYRYGLRSGDLIPADEVSWRAAGLAGPARDPFLVLAERRADAIERWALAHPEDPGPAFAKDDKLDPFPELKEASEKILTDRKAARDEAAKKAIAAAKIEPKAPARPDGKKVMEALAKESAKTTKPEKKSSTGGETPQG